MSDVMRVDVPLEVRGVENFIERNYRDGGRYQWARETLKNSEEAGAGRVLFGVDQLGVESHDVYRLLVADDGPGMTEADMINFFHTYGQSGKSVGGLHENFGIGAKSSLLPWNQYGVIIISYHEDYEDPNVMWLRRSPATGQYGVKPWTTEDGEGAMVAAAHVAELADGMTLDLARVAPDFVKDAGHGTVLLLLGNEITQDTILGDPTPPRNEHLTLQGKPAAPGRALREYLDRRLWDVKAKMTVEVTEFTTADRRRWPRSARRGSEAGQWNRPVVGAKHIIDWRPTRSEERGTMEASGTVAVEDGTEIDWYLWRGARTGMGRAFEKGFIAARYSSRADVIDELFDVPEDGRALFARYRQFGISQPAVVDRTWIIARPPLGGGGRFGVYMTSDRNQLRVQGNLHTSDPLPWSNWAEQFANAMPEPLQLAIAAERSDNPSDPTDDSLRERLAERFSKRWRTLKLRSDEAGSRRHQPTLESGPPRATAPLPRRKRSAQPEAPGKRTDNAADGGASTGPADHQGKPASAQRLAMGLPLAEWADLDAVETIFEPGLMAVWNPPSAVNPDGLIQLNPNHPVVLEELEHWKLQYPPHVESEVEDVVMTVYKELAITAVAHSFAIRPYLNTRQDHDRLIDPAALTMALLGLLGPDSVIGPRLGRLGVKKLNEPRVGPSHG